MNKEYSSNQEDGRIGDPPQSNVYEEEISSEEYPYSYPIWDPLSRMYGYVVVSGVISPSDKSPWERVPQYVFSKRDILMLLQAPDQRVITHCQPYDEEYSNEQAVVNDKKWCREVFGIDCYIVTFNRVIEIDENMNKKEEECSPSTDTDESGGDAVCFQSDGSTALQPDALHDHTGTTDRMSMISQTETDESASLIESCDATTHKASEKEPLLIPSFSTEGCFDKNGNNEVVNGQVPAVLRKRRFQLSSAADDIDAKRMKMADNGTLTVQHSGKNNQYDVNLADIPLPASCAGSHGIKLSIHLPDRPTTSNAAVPHVNGTNVIWDQNVSLSAQDAIDDEIIFIKCRKNRSKVFLATRETEHKHYVKQHEIVHSLVDTNLPTGQKEIYYFLLENFNIEKMSRVRYSQFDFPPSRAGFVTVVSRTLCFHNMRVWDMQALEVALRPMIAVQMSFRDKSIHIEHPSRSAAELILYIVKKYSLFLNYRKLEVSYCDDGFNFAGNKTMWDQKEGAWYFPHQLVTLDNLDEFLARGLVHKETLPVFLQEMEEDFVDG